jgi:Na+/melibiose symporter-like transporter
MVSGFNIFCRNLLRFDGDEAAMAQLCGYVGMVWRISGLFVAAAGVDTSLAQQTPETILNIHLIFAFVPVSMALVAGMFTVLYPLTEIKMKEVRAVLLFRHPEKIN